MENSKVSIIIILKLFYFFAFPVFEGACSQWYINTVVHLYEVPMPGSPSPVGRKPGTLRPASL